MSEELGRVECGGGVGDGLETVGVVERGCGEVVPRRIR